MYVAPETEKPSSALIASSRIYMRYIHIYAYTYTPETEKPSSALIASSRQRIMCVCMYMRMCTYVYVHIYTVPLLFDNA